MTGAKLTRHLSTLNPTWVYRVHRCALCFRSVLLNRKTVFFKAWQRHPGLGARQRHLAAILWGWERSTVDQMKSVVQQAPQSGPVEKWWVLAFQWQEGHQSYSFSTVLVWRPSISASGARMVPPAAQRPCSAAAQTAT